MANVIVEEACLSDIASAIRGKAFASDAYRPSQMAPAIWSIETLSAGVPTPSGTGYARALTGDAVALSQAMSGNSAIGMVYLPQCVSIAMSAFVECSGMAVAMLPALAAVPSEAFMRCGSLVALSVPSCSSVGAHAFAECASLGEVSLPSCETVSEYAFAYCSSLSLVSLPACDSIGENAFYRCTSLSVDLMGPNVCTVASDAFDSVQTLRVVVPAGMLSDYLSDGTGWSHWYSNLYDASGAWGGDYYTPSGSSSYYHG